MTETTRVVGDWGTSRMRLFHLVDGAVVDRVEGPGIGALQGSAADALLAALAPWRRDGQPMRVVLCGMAGARIGLAEAPYAECPLDASRWAGQARLIAIDRIAVAIAAGLACERDGGTPDVMRGEETQIFGAMQLDPSLAQGSRMIALPGTHGKWARIERGRVQSFKTFPSGELFALLRDQSTLTRVGNDAHGEPDGFEMGLASARQREGFLGSLFHARSGQLRAGRTRGWSLGYLSGLIIGTEVEEMLGALQGATSITLVGDPSLVARYHHALEAHALAGTAMDGDDCALAGLKMFEEKVAWT